MATRKELIKEARSLAKTINRRTEQGIIGKKRGYKEFADSSFFEKQREKFARIIGDEPKAGTKAINLNALNKLKKSQLEVLIANEKLFVKSKWSTLTGRQEIARKQLQTLKENQIITSNKSFEVLRKIYADTDMVGALRDKYFDGSDPERQLANSFNTFISLEKAIKEMYKKEQKKDIENFSAEKIIERIKYYGLTKKERKNYNKNIAATRKLENI